jgi:hypothetical protein
MSSLRSNTVNLTIENTISQAPTISYISPTSVKTGETVYVYGNNFNSYTFVVLDSSGVLVPNTTVLGSQTLYFNVPSNTSGGTHSVQVAEKGSSYPASNAVKLYVTNDTTPVVTATFDSPAYPIVLDQGFTLTGRTSAQSGLFTVAVIGPNYWGRNDWATIGGQDILKGGGAYIAVSNKAVLSGVGGWSAAFGGLPRLGSYSVFIYDSSYNLLTSGSFKVTSPVVISACTETDKGIDPNTFGQVFIGGKLAGSDACTDTSSPGAILEYYCKADGTLGSSRSTCTSGCASGRCTPTFTTTSRTIQISQLASVAEALRILIGQLPR